MSITLPRSLKSFHQTCLTCKGCQRGFATKAGERSFIEVGDELYHPQVFFCFSLCYVPHIDDFFLSVFPSCTSVANPIRTLSPLDLTLNSTRHKSSIDLSFQVSPTSPFPIQIPLNFRDADSTTCRPWRVIDLCRMLCENYREGNCGRA